MLRIRSIIKMTKIVFGFLLCLSMSVLQAMQQGGATQFPEPNLPTLIEWTEKCFSQLPEYTNEYKTVLTDIEFLGVLEKCKNMYQNSAFGNKQNWLDGAAPDVKFFKDSGRPDKSGHAYTSDCVQKYKAPVGSKTVFIGDSHGCLHALLRDLLGLVAERKLDNNFKLAPGVTVICLGDYGDRGHYGVEVLYTLCLLKMANWDRVFLLRGNHENDTAWGEQGFMEEIQKKFGPDQADAVFILLFALKLVRYFPLALFFESGNSVIQCCHGGICSGYNPVNLLKASEIQIFERIKPIGQFGDSEDSELSKNKNWAGCLNWVDFVGRDIDNGGVVSGPRGFIYGKNGVNEYLTRINTSLKDAGLKLRLEGFFRGHEHAFFGLKMIGKKGGEQGTGALQNKGEQTHWKQIVSDQEVINTEIFIHNYQPVFTFSTASGTQYCNQPYDCYGVLTTAQEWKDWTLKVYEGKTQLEENFPIVSEKVDGKDVKKRVFKNEKYVEIDSLFRLGIDNQYLGMAIDARWVDAKDKKKPIGDAFIKFAQALQQSDVNEKEENKQDDIKRKREEKEEEDSNGDPNFESKRKKTK